MIKQITTALGDYSTDTELFATVRTAVGNLLSGDKIDVVYGKAGDINCDGNVNNKDVAALFKYVNNIVTGDVDEIAADCNGDGILDLLDIQAIREMLQSKE